MYSAYKYLKDYKLAVYDDFQEEEMFTQEEVTYQEFLLILVTYRKNRIVFYSNEEDILESCFGGYFYTASEQQIIVRPRRWYFIHRPKQAEPGFSVILRLNQFYSMLGSSEDVIRRKNDE